ncbi:unnamed protein product [Eruca vesicaria subsp. sativa]|uniref:Uncharacterized protein n=1 Tax=Eruca vesicaria subsp. sativa TaxID=29727 RepID=A0ABC8J7P4_ERUVS|nr:unnamed protein product [Eruca vesicaria subsp. sativa]
MNVVVHGLKRIPRINFPQRHLKHSEGSTKQVENEADTFFFSKLNTPTKKWKPFS